jgi:hypothetical protein
MPMLAADFSSALYQIGGALGYLLAGCAGTLGTLVITRVQEWRRSRKANQALVTDVSRGEKSLYLLHELLGQLNASRAAIFRVHNGEKYLDDDPIKKISCVAPAVGPGEHHMSYSMQNLPVAMLPVGTFTGCEGVRHGELEDLPPGPVKSAVMDEMGLHYGMYRPLFKNKRIVGLLAAGWRTPPSSSELLRFAANMNSYANRIEGVLYT